MTIPDLDIMLKLFPDTDFEKARRGIGRVKIVTAEDVQNQIVCMVNLCAVVK